MTLKRKNLRRYHRDVFFPDWSEESIDDFLEEVRKNGSVTFSMHALEKIMDATIKHGKNFFYNLVKSIRMNSLVKENIFEFRAIGQKIRKACFRIQSDE